MARKRRHTKVIVPAEQEIILWPPASDHNDYPATIISKLRKRHAQSEELDTLNIAIGGDVTKGPVIKVGKRRA